MLAWAKIPILFHCSRMQDNLEAQPRYFHTINNNIQAWGTWIRPNTCNIL